MSAVQPTRRITCAPVGIRVVLVPHSERENLNPTILAAESDLSRLTVVVAVPDDEYLELDATVPNRLINEICSNEPKPDRVSLVTTAGNYRWLDAAVERLGEALKGRLGHEYLVTGAIPPRSCVVVRYFGTV